ncbi:MAG: MCE family protein [Alphaproteobacteria bacterium]|nr:MCE family protein [Alphaproteobacteria bacterium]
MKDARRYEIGVGLLLVAAAALLSFMAIKIGAVKSLGDNVRAVAVFDDVSGLKDGAAVNIAGVQVGRVSGLEVDFNKAEVGLLIERSAHVREDVIVALRARSVLGEKYIELIPQTQDAPLLEDHEVLTNTRVAVEIDQLVTELAPIVRAVDPDAVAIIVEALADAAKEDPERPARMLADLERLLHNAAEASEQAGPLIADTRAAVGEARGAMSDIRAIAEDGRPLVAKADQVLTNLEDATAELPAATADLPALADDAEATVAEAREVMMVLSANSDRIEHILANVEEIDKWELRRLLREEGIKVRLFEDEVQPAED